MSEVSNQPANQAPVTNQEQPVVEAQVKTEVETPAALASEVVAEPAEMAGNNEFTIGGYKSHLGLTGRLSLMKQEKPDAKGNIWWNAKHSDATTGDIFNISIPDSIYQQILADPNHVFLLKSKKDTYRNSGDPYIKHIFGEAVKADAYI